MSSINLQNVNLDQIINTYRQLHDKAFQANADRKGEILAGIDLTTEALNNQYSDVQRLLVDLGANERQDVTRRETQDIARGRQDAISRGLFNTTIKDSLDRGARDDANRSRERIQNNVAEQQAGIKLSQAGAIERQGNFRANTLNSFTDAYPDTGQFSNLLQQIGAGGGTGRTKTSIGPGSSNFGSRFRSAGSGGGGGSGGSGVQTFTRSGSGGSGRSGGGGGVQTFGRSGGGSGGFSGGAGGAIGQATTAGISQFYNPQDAGQRGTGFDSQFLGQDVYSGGDSIGSYAGGGQVNLTEGLNLLGADGEMDPNRVPEEQGGNAQTPEGGGWFPIQSWYEGGEVVTKETQTGTGKTRIRKGGSA